MLPLLGIIIGLIIGLFLDINIPQAYSVYVAVLILAAFDSLVGALLASLQKKFNILLFVTGLIGNALIAVVLSALGDRLNIDLNLAAIFAFGVRIINNFSQIRRLWLQQISDRRRLARQMRDVIDSGIEEDFLDTSHENLVGGEGVVRGDSGEVQVGDVDATAAGDVKSRVLLLEHELAERILELEQLKKALDTTDVVETETVDTAD